MPTNDEVELSRRERMARLPEVGRLYREGYTVREIAAIHQVTPRVIYRDIEVITKAFRKALEDEGKRFLCFEIAKLNEIEKQAWERYRQSLNDDVATDTATVTTTKDGANGGDPAREKTKSRRKHVRKQNGDPRWFQILLGCIDRRMKLLGLDRPDSEKTEDGAPQVEITEVVVTHPDQVRKIITYADYQGMRSEAVE